MKNALVIFGVLINAVGTSFYLRALFAGTAKPNKMTFLMWSIAPLIGGVAAIAKGVTWSAIPVFAAGLWPLAILIAALYTPHAYWKLKPSDYFCGALSILALLLWAITKEANVAILFAILSYGFAALPTLVKAWRHPETEFPSGYLASSFSGLTGVIAAPSVAFAQVAFPLYLFIMMGLIGMAALRSRRNKNV